MNIGSGVTLRRQGEPMGGVGTGAGNAYGVAWEFGFAELHGESGPAPRPHGEFRWLDGPLNTKE